MATISQVIQDNKWKSVSFKQSTMVTRLFSSGIVSNASDMAQAAINAVDYENVQSVVTTGLVDYAWAEQNFGNATDTLATSLEPVFDECNVKTFYGNQWWAVRGINKDLLNASKPNLLVREKVGDYWAVQWNKIMAATVSGMGDIAAITVGDGTGELSRLMVIQARAKKGDMGWGKLAKMYMNSTTMADIQTKQDNGAIAQLITARYGTVTKVVYGVETLVQSEVPTYVFDGVTEIVVDDAMKNGIISLVENGAFAFAQKDLASPLMYDKQAKSGNGVGKEEWGTKALYILHPVGFSFKGVLGTNYANKSGLTLAELQAGGLYELKVDPKLSPITNLKVKIG